MGFALMDIKLSNGVNPVRKMLLRENI